MYTCQPNLFGRFVRIQFFSDYAEHLQLCEVQILGGKVFEASLKKIKENVKILTVDLHLEYLQY